MALDFKQAIEKRATTVGTLYVSRKLLNSADVIAWAKGQGFAKAVEPGEMHVTVAFSRAPVQWADLEPDTENFSLAASGDREVKGLGDKGALVLRFASQGLTDRWQEFKDAGASWDWPGYQPHVTITYAGSDVDLATVEPYTGPLHFGPEAFAPVDENWTDKITEKRKMTEPTKEQIVAFLKANGAPEIAALVDTAVNVSKESPGVGDVHVSSASGDTPPKKKARNFKAVMDDGKGSVAQTTKREIDWEASITIQKAVPDQQMIFGWASISKVDGETIIDKQGDIIEVEELEKAAYDFTLHSRMHGEMHKNIDTGRLVESIMFTPEKAALGLIAKNAEGQQIFGWWTGFRVGDENLWKDHKAGKLPEFSIGGRASVYEV